MWASEDYEKPMKQFLNVAMRDNKKGTSKKVSIFFNVFPKVTKMIINQLGPKPFHLRGPLNISALDSVMSLLLENYSRVGESTLKNKYSRLIKDNMFESSTRYNTTDYKTVRERFKVVKDYLIGK